MTLLFYERLININNHGPPDSKPCHVLAATFIQSLIMIRSHNHRILAEAEALQLRFQRNTQKLASAYFARSIRQKKALRLSKGSIYM